jgi:hypothetical protein
MKKLAALFALIGAAVLCYSLTLLPYKNEEAFMQQYLAMHSGQSAEYFALREAQLTAKYRLQDIGIEALLFGIIAVVLAREGAFRINSFRSRTAAGIAAFTLGGFKSEVQHLQPCKVRRCKTQPDSTSNFSLKNA